MRHDAQRAWRSGFPCRTVFKLVKNGGRDRHLAGERVDQLKLADLREQDERRRVDDQRLATFELGTQLLRRRLDRADAIGGQQLHEADAAELWLCRLRAKLARALQARTRGAA